MASSRLARTLALAMFAIVAGSANAFADIIDGDWCFEGRHFSIHGPSIMTNEGEAVTGLYTRHSFSYVAPTTAPEAGATILLRLLSETSLRLLPGADAAAQIWRRCDATS